VQPLGGFAQGCVVLFDKIPTDLVLGEIASRALGVGVVGGRRLSLLGRGSRVLVVINITVGRHLGWARGGWYSGGVGVVVLGEIESRDSRFRLGARGKKAEPRMRS